MCEGRCSLSHLSPFVSEYFSACRTVYDSEGFIQFRGLQKADSGEYECVASNSAGIGKAVVTLYYTGKSLVICTAQVMQWSLYTTQVSHW